MDWNSGILWGIIGLIGSFTFSFTFYKLSIKKPKIICAINSHILDTNTLDKIDNLDITYFKNSNKKLIKTTIKIKLSSKNIVTRNDFSEVNPFCIKVKRKFWVKNIESIITHNSNPDNLIKPIVKNKSTILLDFDYLSEEDNITLVILHTGALKVDGKFKKGYIINIDSFERTSNIIGVISSFCFFMFIYSYVLNQTYFDNKITLSIFYSSIVLLIILFPICALKKLLCFFHEIEKAEIYYE